MPTERKMYVFSDGRTIVPDPREEDLPLYKSIWPGFEVQSLKPGPRYRTRLQQTITSGEINHKIDLARKVLASCRLCARQCAANRYSASGFCKLREHAFVIDSFNHISEEAVLNPAWNLKLAGCSWECMYCQSPEVFDVKKASEEGSILSPGLWSNIGWKRSNSLEFVNPNESLPAILEFLSHAPPGFDAPIVWNDSCFGSETAYHLAENIADIYLPDLRWWDESCALKFSNAPGYQKAVQSALEAMISQRARIIVRILILPGHHLCCHKPALEWLAAYRDKVWISILDQYIPQYKAVGHPQMGRMATRDEINAVEELVGKLRFRDVNKNPEKFWE